MKSPGQHQCGTGALDSDVGSQGRRALWQRIASRNGGTAQPTAPTGSERERMANNRDVALRDVEARWSPGEAETHAEHVAALEATVFDKLSRRELVYELEGGELRLRGPRAMRQSGSTAGVGGSG